MVQTSVLQSLFGKTPRRCSQLTSIWAIGITGVLYAGGRLHVGDRGLARTRGELSSVHAQDYNYEVAWEVGNRHVHQTKAS